jgi:hypothetical protein
VYRAHWWTEHDRTNHAWIEAIAPRVQQLGPDLINQLTTVYHAKWQTEPIAVDVTAYASWAGAYTTLHPTHITMSGADPRNQAPAGLEILFHEASHALVETVSDGIARECQARKKQTPRDLWHALLFYTTGEIVKRALIKSGLDTYTPYAYQHGLYDRARGWKDYQRVLERYWQPYLDGKTDFDPALADVVANL